MDLRELLKKIIESRNAAITACKEMLAKADEEKRDLTDEETAEYDKRDKEIEKLTADEKRTRKLIAEEDAAAEAEEVPVRKAPGTPAVKVEVQVDEGDKAQDWRNLGENTLDKNNRLELS